jgi:hypothetical protein
MSKTTNSDKTTGKLSATAQVSSVPCVGNHFNVVGDGSNAVAFDVYDVADSGDAADANMVLTLQIPAGGKQAIAGGMNYRFTKGMYCVLTSAGTSYFIVHKTPLN